MGFWAGVGTLIYKFCGLLILGYSFVGIVKTIRRTPLKKLKFIEKAIESDCSTIGKVSSYTAYGNPVTHEVEYAYSVDGKVYFVTFLIHGHDEKFNEYDEYQPGSDMAIHITDTVTIYYDKRNPKKVAIKKEVFAARGWLRQIKTKKKNPYRDIYKDWTGPIRL